MSISLVPKCITGIGTLGKNPYWVLVLGDKNYLSGESLVEAPKTALPSLPAKILSQKQYLIPRKMAQISEHSMSDRDESYGEKIKEGGCKLKYGSLERTQRKDIWAKTWRLWRLGVKERTWLQGFWFEHLEEWHCHLLR